MKRLLGLFSIEHFVQAGRGSMVIGVNLYQFTDEQKAWLGYHDQSTQLNCNHMFIKDPTRFLRALLGELSRKHQLNCCGSLYIMYGGRSETFLKIR